MDGHITMVFASWAVPQRFVHVLQRVVTAAMPFGRRPNCVGDRDAGYTDVQTLMGVRGGWFPRSMILLLSS